MFIDKSILDVLARRLFRRIKKGKKNECWPWLGATSHGYGTMTWGGHRLATHRLSFLIANGADALEEHDVVRHSCDNRPCCNPAHLLKGTTADNHDDMDRRKRRAVGERLPQSKLTESDVLLIRKEGITFDGQIRMMKKFRISQTNVIAIVKRKIWKRLK